MDCTELAKIFAGDREADLDAAASKAFEEHLNGCNVCLDALALAEEELAPLIAWEAPEPTTAEWDKVTQGMWKEIDADRAVVIRGPWSKLPAVLAMAAAILLIAGLTFVLSQPLGPAAHDPGTLGKFPDEVPGKEPEDSGASSKKDAAPSQSTPGELKRDAQLLDLQVAEGYESSVEEWPVLCVVISEKA